VTRFDLADFLEKTGFSVRRLATYLQVAPGYLEAARTGDGRLTGRDQAACRLLWRRLFQGKQLELPFAESLDTFTRSHAQSLARARATVSGASAKALPTPRARIARAATARGAVAPQQPQQA
jgi:hypothetical protein